MERGEGRGGPAQGLVSGSYSRPHLTDAGKGWVELGGAGMAGIWLALAIHQVEGDFKHWRSIAGHGPAAHPATVQMVVNTDHLIKVLITGEVNTVTLMEGHRLGE